MKIKASLAVLLSLLFLSPGLLPAVQLEYSTYLGGGTGYSCSDDSGKGIAVDSTGCAYIAGYTYSYDFPTVNAFQNHFNQGVTLAVKDAFVSKISSSGSRLVYSTYLGGTKDDDGRDIALNSDGNAFIVGVTESEDFPTFFPYQAEVNGWNIFNIFITRLSASGSALVYSTYLGGAGGTEGNAIIVDSNNNAYITGYTYASDFPTEYPYQSSNSGGADVIVCKFPPFCQSLTFSTYLGGSGDDYGAGIAVDKGGYVYITGSTESADYPVEGAYQSSYSGNRDAFYTQLDPPGDTLYLSTYLGGDEWDEGRDIAADEYYYAYVVGETRSSNFPVVNAYQNTSGGGTSDAFVSKFIVSGSDLTYSTYLGGDDDDSGYSIAVDSNLRAYITGETSSLNFPTLNPYQGIGRGVFVTKLQAAGSSLSYSTYLDGSNSEIGYGIAVDSAGNTYVTGETNSWDFPVKNAYQTSRAGELDAFVTKLTSVAAQNEKRYHTDFNGDGTSDIAIFRSSSGLWAVRGITRAYFGSSLDAPVPGDYNGDGTTDIGIFRYSSGLWAIRGVTRAYFGSNLDTPLPGDYNGDGTVEPGIFRSSSGLWAIRGVTRAYFGGTWDMASPGYYNNDSAMDIGLFRSTSGLWAIRGITRAYFGGSNDTPRPGDYNRNGIWEPAIFRPSAGLWAVRGVTRAYFGSSGDEPVPADYNGKNSDSPGIFRSSSGLWAARGITRVYFGGTGDTPVTR